MADGVVGLDLSLTATGICDASGRPRVVRPGELRGMERIDYIHRAVLDTLTPDVGTVAIESYSFASQFRAHQLGELGGVIRRTIWLDGLVWWDIAPTTLKKYATSHGKATKEEVVANARERLGYGGFDPDEADAMWLWAIGRALVGDPVVDCPTKAHANALANVIAVGSHGRRAGTVIDIDTKGRT